MRNSFFIQISCLLLAQMFMGTTCHKDVEDYKYKFVEKINLFPANKSYKIGDTIWIQYSNPDKKLFEQSSSKYITADTVSVTFQTSFNALYDYPINPSGGFCDYVTANGINVSVFVGEYSTRLVQTIGCNSTNSYDFKIGVVLKQAGIYSLNLNGVPLSVSACSNRISNFPFSSIDYQYNLTDCNKDVYLSIPPDARSEPTKSKGIEENLIDKKKVFVFKVE